MRRDRAERRVRRARAGRAVHERERRHERAARPPKRDFRTRLRRVGDAERPAIFVGEKRCDARDRAWGQRRARNASVRGARDVDRLLRIERPIDEKRGARRRDPRGRPLEQKCFLRGDTLSVDGFERGKKRRFTPDGAQGEPAQVDAKLREFRGMTTGRGLVVESQTRMPREPEERARECALGGATGKRLLHGLIAHQLAIEFVPIVVRRRIHHRDDRLRVAHGAAKARGIEDERRRERRTVRRREHGPHAARAALLRLDARCGQPAQIEFRRRFGIALFEFRLRAHGLERRDHMFADPASAARTRGAQRERARAAAPLDHDLTRAARILDERIDLELFDGTQDHALRFHEGESRAYDIACEPRTDGGG